MVPREKDYGFVIMARLGVCACVPLCVSGRGEAVFVLQTQKAETIQFFGDL